ncbi:hypothetical protein [Streptomyces buecherae]|uniref:DUF7848 domain-containing protein n=1 Tax=Streptomyces buecherae TaxID=2763006 RepID=A0A7H8NB00_9ACTN|nr:hypothetical protein [Streptomyces buecherae]QKW51623.1 hypothetical protein HUT08_21235 [Streptomyces buecherae]
MSRSRYRYVEMRLGPDPEADAYLVRATCVTCGEQSSEPEPSESITGQHRLAQRWCTSHAARDHPDGRHVRYAATVTLRWLVTPAEDIGPVAPGREVREGSA